MNRFFSQVPNFSPPGRKRGEAEEVGIAVHIVQKEAFSKCFSTADEEKSSSLKLVSLPPSPLSPPCISWMEHQGVRGGERKKASEWAEDD